MASTEYKVKGKTFTSPHTNAEAIGVLGKLVKDEQATGEFPASLVKQFARKKDLSEKQWPFVHLLVWKVENGATGETALSNVVLATPFIEIVAQVAETAAKVYAPECGPIQMGIAGGKATFPGSINVTDGQGFKEGAWFGRIVKVNKTEAIFQPGRDCTAGVHSFVQMFGDDPVCVSLSYAEMPLIK